MKYGERICNSSATVAGRRKISAILSDARGSRAQWSVHATASGASAEYRLSITCTRTYNRRAFFRSEFVALFPMRENWRGVRYQSWRKT